MTEALDKAYYLVSLQNNNSNLMQIFVIDEAGSIIYIHINVCAYIVCALVRRFLSVCYLFLQ